MSAGRQHRRAHQGMSLPNLKPQLTPEYGQKLAAWYEAMYSYFGIQFLSPLAPRGESSNLPILAGPSATCRQKTLWCPFYRIPNCGS